MHVYIYIHTLDLEVGASRILLIAYPQQTPKSWSMVLGRFMLIFPSLGFGLEDF